MITGIREVQRNLAALYAGQRAALAEAFKEIGALLLADALENHPWKDQTGDTRASMKAEIVKADVDEIVLSLSAGMDYDVFLELARDGKWAWLWPCMMRNQDRIIEILLRHGQFTAAHLTSISSEVKAV